MLEFDSSDAPNDAEYEIDDAESVCRAIVSAVATATAGRDERDGGDPASLEPLYDTVDAEALGAFLDSATGPASVSFTYCGCKVTITDDETVVVQA